MTGNCGLKRNDPVRKFTLRHGDIAVWGGRSRLCYHGVPELKDGEHEKMDAFIFG